MIEQLAYQFSNRLKEVNPDHPVSLERQKYALILLLNGLATLFLTILISLITNHTTLALVALGSFAILRQFSGGVHLKSSDLCALTSSIGANLISMVPMNVQSIVLLNVISLTLVLIFAPSRVVTRFPKSLIPQLKYISAGIVALNFFVLSPVISLAFFIQGITLIISKRR